MPQRILCIESDGPFRARVRRALEAEGFAVDEAPSGLAGIQRALTLPPDLVLVDVHLPDIDGVEIATRLKQERSLASVPFLALGDGAAEHDVALAAGADAFLAKPVDDRRLADEVRAVLAGRRERLAEEGERAGLKALSASMVGHLEHALEEARVWEDRCAERDRLGRIFIGNLAHELRTALTPISGYLKILASDKLGPLSEQQRRILESIQGASGSTVAGKSAASADCSVAKSERFSTTRVMRPEAAWIDSRMRRCCSDSGPSLSDARIFR